MAQQELRKGTKCHICTGCGRCFGGGEGIHVMTGEGLAGEWLARIQKRVSEGAAKASDWLAAVDIGTTTIAMVLYDPEGQERDRFVTVNPQTSAGADVISRIQEASVSEKAAADMRESVERVLSEGLDRFRRLVSVAEGCQAGQESGIRMVIAANTTMIYLLMGYETGELGQIPFEASHLEEIETELAGAPAYIMPGLSAFVGADILAGIYASGMAESRELTLLIDLGTNGEMAIGNQDRIIACSTAAGPAFEGGATRGVWGADMVSLTARLLREELLDETGLLDEDYFEEGILIGDVRITQQAIRNLQLAKAAIAAGIGTLTMLYGADYEQIDRVVLAGGFGYYLKAEDAAAIGLLPAALAGKVQSAGNTALAGALRFGFSEVLDRKQGEAALAEPCAQAGGAVQKKGQFNALERTFLREIVSRTENVNLAETKDFNQRFVDAMFLEEF